MKKLMIFTMLILSMSVILFLSGCDTQTANEEGITEEEKQEIKTEVKKEIKEEVKQEVKKEAEEKKEETIQENQEKYYVIDKYIDQYNGKPMLRVNANQNADKSDANTTAVIVSEETYNQKEIGDTFKFKKQGE